MKKIPKSQLASTGIKAGVLIGLSVYVVNCGKDKKELNSLIQPAPTATATATQAFSVSVIADGLTVTAPATRTASGSSAVLTLSAVADGTQVITARGTCPAGKFTGPLEYTTGPLTADCVMVFKSGNTVDFAADALPAGGKVSIAAMPVGELNVQSAVTGTCPAGTWQGSAYSLTGISSACSVTFGTVALSGTSVTVKPQNAAHTYTYSIAQDASLAWNGVKFSGLAVAAATANLTPSYTFNYTSTTCGEGSYDPATKVFRTSSAPCDVVFTVDNPCGDSGIADPTTIKYTSTNATDPARIDRLLTSSTTTSILTSSSPLSVTGTGIYNCANSSCHGKATSPSAQSKWTIFYSSATASTSYSLSAAGFPWTSFDTTAGADNTNKLLTPSSGGPSWVAFDPLNSRYFRKVTPSFSSGARMPKVGAVVSNGTTSYPGCSPAAGSDWGGTCFTEAQANQMCHWIWNGAQYN